MTITPPRDTVARRKLDKLCEKEGAASQLARDLSTYLRRTVHRAMISQWRSRSSPRDVRTRQFFARRGIKLTDWETLV